MTTDAAAVPAPRLDHGRIAALGILTIACYGTWYYAFGVLVDPIVEDTGWSYTEVSAAFSVGQLLIGATSVLGGLLLDRLGSRIVFLAAAGIAAGSFLVTSLANHPAVFVASAAVGMGALGALGFYHVTMAAAVRVNPAAPGRAIAVLTLWGALSSAIYLPATAWLVDALEWRATVRVLVASAVVALVITAATVSTGAAPARVDGGRHPTFRETCRSVASSPERRRFALVVALTGLSMSLLLVYQVPIMRAAGLDTATAAAIAGLRGVAQLGGRIPIGVLLRRHHANTLLAVALGCLALGAVVINAAGSIPLALVFALAAGVGIGAFSPLQGIRSEELFDRESLGTTMGLLASVGMTAGALGPVGAGAITDATGDPRAAAWIAAAAALAAALLVRSTSRAG